MNETLQKLANALAERVLSIIEQRSKSLFEMKIWKIDDVVEATGFKKQTIYNKVSNKEIPYRKRGKKLFFIPDEIIDWIHEGDEL